MKRILPLVLVFTFHSILSSQIAIEVFRSEYEQINDFIYDINDANEGAFNYAITSGNDSDYYKIDANTGVIAIQNTIPDSFTTVHTDVLTVSINSNLYDITIRDGYDYIISTLDSDYTVLDEHNEQYIDNTNNWTAKNSLWGKGEAIPNTDFRIATIYKPNLPNATLLLWDVPSKASDFGGASVWCYNNLFWGNRKNSREDLIGFPFQISAVESLSVDFDFEQLFGSDKFKIAMNMFMTDEDVLSDFSENDGDFFFVFDQNGTFIPNYTNTLPDIVIDNKPFAVRYDLNPDNGYERRRVIIKDNETFMSGNLDVKSLFDMFANESFLNENQFIYHLQFGIEVTDGFGAVRFNQLNVNSNIASIYYVDQQNGDDSNDGTTPNTAFQSFDQAQSVVSPGDTIKIMGEYHNTSYNPNYSFGAVSDAHLWHAENTIKINNLHGSEGNPITIKAYDENTVLKGDGANIFRITDSSFLNIEDFNIEGEVNTIPLSTANALQFAYLIDDNTLQGTATAPASGDIRFRNEDETNDSDSIVEDTDTYTDISTEPVVRPSYIDTRGLYISTCNNINIKNNTIHHTPGGGLRVAESNHVDIVENEIYRCSARSYSGTHALVVTKTEPIPSDDYSVRILKNNVHHNYNEQFSWSPGKTIITPRIDEGKGISLQRNNTTNWINGTGRILVANNLCYWNGFSGVHSNDGYRIDFINNTCYMNSYTNTITYPNEFPTEGQQGNNIGISASNGGDIKMINNIAVIDTDWGGFPISITSDLTSSTAIQNNLVFGIGANPLAEDADVSGIDQNTLESDPLFVNAGNHLIDTTHDFSVQANSPARGIADISFAPADDFFGFSRDATPDLGAIEYIADSPVSPEQMVLNMGRGINAGNVMSAPVEGNWAPAFTESYFSDIKDAGFTTVRIPMDFFGDRTSGDTTGYSKDENTESEFTNNPITFTVSPAYLDRVEQVINWALSYDLITILDFHGADLKSEFLDTFDQTYAPELYTHPTSAKRAADNEKFRSIWSQIANRLKDYSHNLVFEVVNEPYFRLEASEMDTLNSDIISIIRGTGHNNTDRNIIITGGGKNSWEAPLQIDPGLLASDDNLIATFHYYLPRAFTASSSEDLTDYDWGTPEDKLQIDTDFSAVQSWATTNNIPVFLGEFGADNEGGYNYDTQTYGAFGGPENASRVEYHRYLAQKAIDLGFSFTAWDAGHKSNKTIYIVSDRTWVEDVKNALLGITSITYTFTDGTWTPTNPSGVSTSNDTILIASGNANTDNISTATYADNLTINTDAKLVINVGGALHLSNMDNQGTLTIRSNANQYGSLIVDNIVNEGLLEYRLYVNSYAATNGNDLISAPFTGVEFAVFEQYQSNDINIYENPSDISEKLFGPFDKASGTYKNYDLDIISDQEAILEPGIGYRTGADPASTNNPNTFVFKGDVNINNVEVPIFNSGPLYQRWNLIGNPYPSYIDFETFYNTNFNAFDTGIYKAIWGYNATANSWTVWNNLAILDDTVTELIAPGQGFFVTSNAGGGLINFTVDSRRSGTSNNFIANKSSNSLNLSKAKLNLNKNSENYSTDIYFVDNATQGVDPGYDAAAFGGSASAIFSEIVDGSSQEELAIQALPYNDFNDVVVPLGIEANAGEQIRVSLDATATTLPDGINVYLEDNVAGTYTLLNTSDFVLTPSTTLSSTGRFFVHFTSTTLSNSDFDNSSLLIYVNQDRKSLEVKGLLQDTTDITVHDIQGRVVLNTQLGSNSSENTIDVSSINTGIYIVNLNNSKQQKVQKVIIK